MARIPVPDQINPRAIAGDRLAMQAPDLSAPARALQGLGGALSGLAERYQADKNKMDAYNTNLQLEKFTTDQTIGYQQDLDTSAPDGSDFLAKREKGLTEGYQKIRAGIKDPELGAKADLVFEQLRGNQLVKGTQAVKSKQFDYVKATTGASVQNVINSGSIETLDQYNDYYENVVKPRIDSVISDPLQKQEAYGLFGKQMRDEFIKRNPDVAIPKPVSGGAGGYYKRLAQIESGGNPNAKNKSGASGLYQFMPQTAKQYGLADPFDPVQSQVAVERFTANNKAYLTKVLGRAPSAGELYLAHQQGAGGASKLLANPDALAADVVGRQAVLQNGGTADMTARDFANKWISKFEGVPGPSATSAQMPQGGIWEGMDETEWSQVTSAAARADRDRIKQEAAAQAAAADEVVKSGYDLMTQDQLTPDWVAENREILSPTEYRYFNDALRRNDETVKTDNSVYVGLLDRAMKADDQATVQDEAFQAFAEGRVSKTDFGRLVAASRKTASVRQEKPWLGDIRKTLSARLAPIDSDDTDQYAKRLDGLFALDDWVSANPGATRDEVKKKSTEIAKEYSASAVADLRAGLDMPKYSTVARYAMTPDSMAVSAQKLAQAYKDGKISAEELNRETALLKRWSSIFDEEAKLGTVGP